MRLNELTAAELLPLLARREISTERLAHDCLERIATRDWQVRAFAHIEPARVLSEARTLDAGAVRGPLHGLPIAVKDIFDTYDAPTEYGSPIYAGHQPRADAAIVAIARQCGALILGKTVTTEFASFPPGPTVNPHTLAHTPGGSSSGSAAAVADNMTPFAFGTQTTGSIIRPAAFCGAVGYKPTFAMLPRVGVKAISDCLDTVGGFARKVADVAFVIGALAGRSLALADATGAPRLGICRTPQWPQAQVETHALWERERRRLDQAGARMSEIELPNAFDALADAQNTIWEYEMARCLADEYHRHAEQIREPLRSQIASGLATSVDRYDAALRLGRECRRRFADAMQDFDALIVPSTPGEAPAGISATGDPVFNRMWSLLHTPALHVPTAIGPNRLPLGLQVVGRLGDDARVLAAAHWIQKQLRVEAL